MQPSQRALGQRAPLLWLLLPLMVGLVLGKLQPITIPVPLALICALATALMAVRSRRACWWGVWIALSVMCSGLALYELRRARHTQWDGMPPREARLVLRVERLFSPSEDRRKVGGVAIVHRTEPHLRALEGQSVYFSGRLARGVQRPIRSSEVEVVGSLEVLPRNPAADTFDGYLAGAGVNFKFKRARVMKLVSPASRYWQFCARVQERMAMILGFGLEAHPELAGDIRAMLLGQLFELSEEQQAWFKQSGTFHLFSISGLHIGAIVIAISGVLKLTRMPPLAWFLLTAVIVWLYVDINGRAPSAVRSFLMFGMLEASRVLRVPRGSLSALTVSALAVLLFDPLQLFSASFQMSYGIVASLLALGVPLGEAWERRWALFTDLPSANWTWVHRVTDGLWRRTLNGAALGLSTALVSAVTGVIYFGLISPGSLLANFVMIPVSMVPLLAGLASLIVGLSGGLVLSVIFNHAAALVFFCMDECISAFVSLPGVFFSAGFVAPWMGFCVLAGLVGLILIGFHAGWPRRFGGYLTPFVYTASMLILLVTFSNPS